MTNIIPTEGASWKHALLARIASSKEFPTRLRLFHLVKRFLGLSFLKASTPSGVQLLLNIEDYVQYQIYFFGNYEPKSVELFKQLSLESQVIFDVGAHVGQYALESATSDPDQKKQIFAIEANPYTFSFLINNIRLNNFKQITAVLGAVNNDQSLVKMTIPSYRNLGNTQIAKDGSQIGVESYYINSIAIDKLIEFYDIKEIDLMKIDIEGHEYSFFEKLFKTKIFPKKIIFEYIPDAFINCEPLITLFGSNHYRIYNISGELFTLGQVAIEQNLMAVRII
jgi:FkbM family methyltransferase